MNRQGRGFSHLLRASAAVVALLALAATAAAQVGTLQGMVNGVPLGTVLAVFKGEAKAADLTVGADGKFSLTLGTGVYTVKCPNGTTPKIAVLNGASSTNINCK